MTNNNYYLEEKKFLGVCSWLSNRTGWSVKKIRLALIAATVLPMGSDLLLLGGSLFMVYLVTALTIRLVD